MKILDTVSKWMGQLLILAIIVGYFIPFLAFFRPIVSWCLMFLLFSSFLSLELKIHRFFRKELLLFPIMNWLILPLVVFYISRFLSIDYRIGLFLIIITPPALGSPIIVRLARGDVEFSVANLVVFNLLSPVVYAILPGLFFSQISEIASPFSVFKSVALYIFIPLLLSLISRQFFSFKNFILQKTDPFKGVIQLFMIAVVVSSSSAQIKALPIAEAIIIFSFTLVISFIYYLTGFLICRRNSNLKYTCPVTSGYKNTLLSIITGLTNFNPVVALPSIFYLISHHVWNGLIIYLANKKKSINDVKKSGLKNVI